MQGGRTIGKTVEGGFFVASASPEFDSCQGGESSPRHGP